MNKQEAIEKLKSKAKPHWLDEEIYGDDWIKSVELNVAIGIVNQIDEPEKPVVPQFVADWYVDHKAGFELHLSYLCINAQRYPERVDRKVLNWYNNLENEPIRTLVNMHQFGYEVEKQKLYTVEIPNPNSAGGKLVLSKQQSTGRLILEMLNSDINKPKYLHLTEAEIKQDFEWAWQFAKEVKE